ncbi:MAG: ATP-binding protein [Bacteroidales bacterium]|nr:ATP-binding protein [Bacteroidales bacterium]
METSNFINRAITPAIEKAYKYYPVLTITGPRQSGKSTLCRHLFPDFRYVNLENISTRSQAATDPEGFLTGLGDTCIIDEVQHVPELLSEIQVKVDEDRSRKFILTGSSNFSLLHNVSQSLAGRTAVFSLLPLSMSELSPEMKELPTDSLMFRGFYPGVIANSIPADMFYTNYYDTYVERDLRDLLRVGNLVKFDRFVRMLALRVGSEFNASALSREVGVSSVTIAEWLSMLQTSYIVFELPPYYSNQTKSLTKNKKIYFYDTGLLCNLLSITEPGAIANNVLRGAIFENMAVAELMKRSANAGKRPAYSFYRQNSGMEVDVVNPAADGSIDLYEIKAGKTLHSDYASNMKRLAETLQVPSKATVIYDGDTIAPTAINVRDI